MASDLSFVEYVRDQMNGAGQISFKKMFGEYAVYYNEKIVALVCDNQLFIKPTASGRSMFNNVVEAPPYPGAKPYFLVEEQLDDQQWLSHLIQLTASEIPAPKSRSQSPKRQKYEWLHHCLRLVV